jgi:hypothetical protein
LSEKPKGEWENVSLNLFLTILYQQKSGEAINHQPGLGLWKDGNRWFGQRVQRNLPSSFCIASFPTRNYRAIGMQARERNLVIRSTWYDLLSVDLILQLTSSCYLGTGKTLMARQIGNMLNSREPKIVNGPQILDKYVGESEANIRRLFADAEEEEKRLGPNSGLHIIIFDEIDAICKSRGSVAGNSGVHDTVVNQLLAKIDGVEQLNNILVIGMTNRRDMIDEGENHLSCLCLFCHCYLVLRFSSHASRSFGSTNGNQSSK